MPSRRGRYEPIRMPNPLRTFVAVEIAAEVRDRIARLIARLQTAQANVRWVAAENLHLTLKFLGDVDITDTPDICTAVARAAADLPPFQFECRGTGAFPNINRPRTLWIGLGVGAEKLSHLQAAIENALENLGYPKELRRFHGHLTIGRIRQGRQGISRLAELLHSGEDLVLGTTRVQEAIIFSSRLGRTGSRYEPLGRARLQEA